MSALPSCLPVYDGVEERERILRKTRERLDPKFRALTGKSLRPRLTYHRRESFAS